MRQTNTGDIIIPRDIMDLIVSFVYRIPARELFADVEYFLKWQQNVPPMFLSATLLDNRFYYRVANPMRRFHPYTPRRFLHMKASEIWGSTLPALVNMLCAERVREIRTYKGCIRRWTIDCTSSRSLAPYIALRKKALTKLTQEHFRRSFPRFFVREALRQIRALAAVS